MANIYGNFGDAKGGTGNYVTLDTDQEITGKKRFKADITIDAFTDATDIEFANAAGESMAITEVDTSSLVVDTEFNVLNTATFAVDGTANFNGDVNFFNVTSPPHCAAVPQDSNDLCNKQYVDAKAALTAYQLYFNYSQPFVTPPPASISYKLLSPTQVLSPATVPWTTAGTGSYQIEGFFNTIANLQIQTSIPEGVWTLLLYCNVDTSNDQGHVGAQFKLVGYDSSGSQTVLYQSPVSPLITVIAPQVGMSSVTATVPTISLTPYTGLGVDVFLINSNNQTHTGSIYYQSSNRYSSILTSYASQQAPNILALDNTWTGTNTFNNAIQATGGVNGNVTGNVTGNLTGTASTATNALGVSLTADDPATNGDYAVPFSKTVTATNNILYYDNVPARFSYNPIANRMTIGQLLTGEGGFAGTNSCYLFFSTDAGGVNYRIRNYAPAGTTSFQNYDATNNPFNVWICSTVDTNSLVPAKCSQTLTVTGTTALNAATTISVAGSVTGLTVKDTTTNNQLLVVPNASGANYNAATVANDVLITPTGSTVGTKNLMLTVHSATNSGVRVSANKVVVGAGGAVATPANRVDIDGSTNSISLVSTTCAVNAATTITIAGAGTALSIRDSLFSQGLAVIPNSGGQAFNPIVQANDVSITTSGTINVEPLVISSYSNTNSGLRITNNRVIMGAGGTGFTPSTRIDLNATGPALGLVSTVCPTASGFTALAATDDSSNIATTAFVQDVITQGISAAGEVLATHIKGGLGGQIPYQTAANTTALLVNGSAGQFLTSQGTTLAPYWSSSVNATTISVQDNNFNATYYPIFVDGTAGAGKTVLFDSITSPFSYVPQSGTLNALVYTIGGQNQTQGQNTSKLIQINNSINILNNATNGFFNLVLNDAGGTSANRFTVTSDEITAHQKLSTVSGIIGPTSSLAYANNMIGYSQKIAGDGANVAMISTTWYTINTTSFLFPTPGVYMVCMNILIGSNATAGNVIFTNAGLSTDTATPTVFEISIAGMTTTKPAVAGYASGAGVWVATITNASTPYYINTRSQFTGTALTLYRTLSSLQYTRIA